MCWKEGEKEYTPIFVTNAFKQNQQDAKLHNWYLLLQVLYMLQEVPPPIIRSSKLYKQHRVFVEL
jgi:hypothetical protein